MENGMNTKELIAQAAFKNAKDEMGTNEGYMELLSLLVKEGDKEGVKLVKEIMADENNHLLKNLVIALQYSDTQISKDGAQESLDFIQKKIA